MTKNEQVHAEVEVLRRRITELEAQVATSASTELQLPGLADPFATLFRASPVAVVITAIEDGRYLDVNDQFARITGYTREEVIGATSSELQIWANPDDRLRIGELFKEQVVIRDVELDFRTKAREVRTVIASLALIDFEDTPCVLTMCHDITERQQAAQERERLLAEAQAAVRLRDEFLSVASHELKTPLTALRLHIETMQRIGRKADTSEPTLQRIMSKLDISLQQINRLTELVNGLLDVTRIREGRLGLDLEPLDLGQVVQAIAEQFEEQFEQADSTVQLELAADCTICADRSRLEQIITNLLSNAVKYGRGGPINVFVFGDATVVRLSVQDHGIGIAAADQQRIFERFERAVSTQHYGGMGLGLFVVHQLVTLLGGTIAVESTPGDGSTFTVTFPRYVQSQ
ncbi:MAG: PAS domain S-box protein [Chloroflexi bacterium]|nr:PAS domain S-box protein [Chloroflexota bacterium]